MKNKILIVVAGYYKDISDQMLNSTINFLNKKLKYQIIEVPGIFEIPVVISKNIKKYNGIIALGCVIKGETAHFEYISGSCANALANLNIHSKIPVLFGVVTAYNRKQAEERSQINFDHADNKNIGFNVANAAKILLSSETL